MRTGVVLCAVSLAIFAVGCKPVSSKPKISDIFRDQLMRFLETSGELSAATSQGLNLRDFMDRLAKVKSAFELISATWPGHFVPEAKKELVDAIEGWDLAGELWNGKIEKLDAPTEPNINGYARFVKFAPGLLKTGKHGSLVKEYEGKTYITQSHENISQLLSMASEHSVAAKSAILSALASDN